MLHRIFQMLHSDSGQGPVWTMLTTFRKYSLVDQLINSIESGNYMEYKLFKRYAKMIVCDKDLQRWKITCKMYKSMALVNVNDRCHQYVLGWIQFMHKAVLSHRKCRSVIKLLLNVYRLGKKPCSLCTTFMPDSIDHILFVCSGVDIVRGQKWNQVLQACPGQLANELGNMSSLCKAKFILNACYCPYVPEWHNLYIALCDFVHDVNFDYYSATQEG